MPPYETMPQRCSAVLKRCSRLARAKAFAASWEKFSKNPVIPATKERFGDDRPEWVQIGDKPYLYYRAATGPTTRAALVWKKEYQRSA